MVVHLSILCNLKGVLFMNNAKKYISENLWKVILVVTILVFIFLADKGTFSSSPTKPYETLLEEYGATQIKVAIERTQLPELNYVSINCSGLEQLSDERLKELANLLNKTLCESKGIYYYLQEVKCGSITISIDVDSVCVNGKDINKSNAVENRESETTNQLTKVKCSFCNGSGSIKYYYGDSALQAALDGYDDYEYGPCPSCNGTGYTYAEESNGTNKSAGELCSSCKKRVTSLITKADMAGVNRTWCSDCWAEYDRLTSY